MITEMDSLRCQNTFDMIDSSGLDIKIKSDLKEVLEESKLNLNGRSLDERVMSIARNQFNSTRFLVEILVQNQKVADRVLKTSVQKSRSWKDVLVECRWVLGLVLVSGLICSVFQPQIAEVLGLIVRLF